MDEMKREELVPEYIYEWLLWCKKKNKSLSYAMHDMFSRNFLLERFGDNDPRVRWLSDPKHEERFAKVWLSVS